MMDKDNSKISILIVPHTQKVKRISIPNWFPKAALAILSVLTISLVLYIKISLNYQANLIREANEKIALINDLEEENRNKEQKLISLEAENRQLLKKTEEVEVKLNEIDKLQRTLEKLAGIDSPSRGGAVNRNIEMDISSPSEEMSIVSEILSDKKLELEIFIEDVEAQFEYLETVPNNMPASGRITSKFGNRRDPFTRRIQFHQGIDIANSSGTDIKAAAKGTVIFAGRNGGYGRTVIVDHGNGYKTLYAHNREILVKKGEKVEKGQVIAKMGSTGRSTGVHLHFEIHKNNKAIDPLSLINN